MANEEFKIKGEDLLKKVKELIKEGNARRIIIKDDKGTTFMEIPLTVGVIGVAAAPVLAAVGALAAMAAKFTIVVVKNEDSDENISLPG